MSDLFKRENEYFVCTKFDCVEISQKLLYVFHFSIYFYNKRINFNKGTEKT